MVVKSEDIIINIWIHCILHGERQFAELEIPQRTHNVLVTLINCVLEK